jgi:hypothetical protein
MRRPRQSAVSTSGRRPTTTTTRMASDSRESKSCPPCSTSPAGAPSRRVDRSTFGWETRKRSSSRTPPSTRWSARCRCARSPDDRAAVAEVRRVLRPGGRFVILEHVRSPARAVRGVQRLVAPSLHERALMALLTKYRVGTTRSGLGRRRRTAASVRGFGSLHRDAETQRREHHPRRGGLPGPRGRAEVC